MKIENYEVNPVSVGDMLPILDLANTDPTAFQMKLVAASITKDGMKLTEAEIKAIPFGLYMKKLIPAVVEMNGLGDSGNE